jgi:hypothetical protein
MRDNFEMPARGTVDRLAWPAGLDFKSLAMAKGISIITISPQGIRVYDNVKWVSEGELWRQRLVNPHDDLFYMGDPHTPASLVQACYSYVLSGLYYICIRQWYQEAEYAETQVEC